MPKQIDNISLADAIRIAKQEKMKMDFKTTDADIKAFARNILRKQKKDLNDYMDQAILRIARPNQNKPVVHYFINE